MSSLAAHSYTDSGAPQVHTMDGPLMWSIAVRPTKRTGPHCCVPRTHAWVCTPVHTAPRTHVHEARAPCRGPDGPQLSPMSRAGPCRTLPPRAPPGALLRPCGPPLSSRPRDAARRSLAPVCGRPSRTVRIRRPTAGKRRHVPSALPWACIYPCHTPCEPSTLRARRMHPDRAFTPPTQADT